MSSKKRRNFQIKYLKNFFFQNLTFSLQMFEIKIHSQYKNLNLPCLNRKKKKKKRKYSFARKKKKKNSGCTFLPPSLESALWPCVLVLSGTEMSMYFFRLHNLRRQAEEVRKKRQKGKPSQSGQRGTNTDQSQPTAGSMHCCNKVHRGPSRLFERAPLQPSDSLDEIAFQIPR